jgi:hypothetical protein
MNNITIIPSSREYKSAPSVDQKISVSLFNDSKLLTEFDISLNANIQVGRRIMNTFMEGKLYLDFANTAPT